jgi:hypothetical protein
MPTPAVSNVINAIRLGSLIDQLSFDASFIISSLGACQTVL